MDHFEKLGPRDVEALFKDSAFTSLETYYLMEQSRRLAYLNNLVGDILRREGWEPNRDLQILDIGPHFFTYILRKQLGPDFILNTIGWTDERFARDEIVHNHIDLDLNDCCNEELWPRGETHQIIIIAEVIEHLYTSPKFVLRMLRSLLHPSGYIIIQTPNSVAIRKRMEMLRGRNPFELIRETANPPGHFREYTASELIQLCEEAGLHCEELRHEDYWPEKGAYRLLEKFWSTMRGGLTALCRAES